jgi:hypothetical protein
MRTGRGLADIRRDTRCRLVPVQTRIRVFSPFARGMNKRHGAVSACVAAERVSRIYLFAALRDGMLGQ